MFGEETKIVKPTVLAEPSQPRQPRMAEFMTHHPRQVKLRELVALDAT